MKSWRFGSAAIVVFISAATLFSQVSANSRTLLLAMAANTKRMTQYQWKQRITVTRKGKPAQPVIDQISFEPGGGMHRTTISAPEEMGGIRGRIAAGVRQNVKDIMELVGRYNKPQQMVATINKAKITQNSSDGTLRLQANGLIQPNDSMTMIVDATTHLAKQVQITTGYDGSPMTVVQDYGSIPNGPNVMKSIKVAVPQKELAIDVASYDFAQQTSKGR